MTADARQTNPLAAAAPARLETLFLPCPEVECIGKGKANAPYEFGVKRPSFRCAFLPDMPPSPTSGSSDHRIVQVHDADMVFAK
jgi:hypothetical protein